MRKVGSRSTSHSEVMEWTTISVSPDGREHLSEGSELRIPDWTVLGLVRTERSGILFAWV